MLLSRSSPLFPYTTLFRSTSIRASVGLLDGPDPEEDMKAGAEVPHLVETLLVRDGEPVGHAAARIEVDRKSTRLNSSHLSRSNDVIGQKQNRNVHTPYRTH